MEIRDRIVGLKRIKASELKPCPLNWRTHGDKQRTALRSILGEIGLAQALVARQLKDGSYMLIDGHLRQEELGTQKVPVLVLDVTEAEALKLLAVLDPLAALAGADGGKLREVLRKLKPGDEVQVGLFSELAKLHDADDASGLELDVDGGKGGVVGSDEAGEVEASHVRMVQLFLNTDTLPAFQKHVEFLAEVFQTNNPTDTVLKALRFAYRAKKSEKVQTG